MNEEYKEWKDVTAAEPCRHCGKGTWCSRNSVTGQEICRRKNTGRASVRTDRSGATYFLYDAPPNHDGRPVNAQQSEAIQKAAPQILNATYQNLLTRLSLSGPHRENLRRRGLTDEQIALRGYASLPLEGRPQVVQELLKESTPETLLAVPGFARDDKGEVFLAGASGLLIPVRQNSQILALKIRVDDEGLGSRYISLSSKKYGGPGQSPHLHEPLGSPRQPALLRITEGELKADIATALSQEHTVAIPGVGMWKKALEYVVRHPHIKEIRVAFDQDARTKLNVLAPLLELFTALLDKNYAVSVELWKEVYKGIDDALAAGEVIQVLLMQEARAYLEQLAEKLGHTGGQKNSTSYSSWEPNPKGKVEVPGVILADEFLEYLRRNNTTLRFYLGDGRSSVSISKPHSK